jgi:hypothetical protein
MNSSRANRPPGARVAGRLRPEQAPFGGWAPAELAATNATPEDVAELAQLLATAEPLMGDAVAFTDAASAFHAVVARASHRT